MCLPVRMALTKVSSDRVPMPVLLSGVRFFVYVIPHGPAQAVIWPVVWAIHGPFGAGGGGSFSST